MDLSNQSIISNIPEFVYLLKSGDMTAVHDHLHKSYKGERTKLNVIIQYFCSHYIDSNIWPIAKIHKHLKDTENATPQALKQSSHYILALLSKMHYKDLDITFPTQDSVTEIMKTHNTGVPYFTTKYHDIFKSAFIEHLTLFELLIRERKPKEAIIVMNYMFSLKPASIFVITNPTPKPLSEILFDLFFEMASSAKTKDFIGYAKDLFFYNIKKEVKKTLERLPLLYYSLIAAIKNHVKCKQLDIPPAYMSMNDRMSYLYVLPEYDTDICTQLDAIKERRSRAKQRLKAIDVNSKEYEKFEKLQNSISITISK